jgi:dolichyl-phosphate mannosyltransferase polypeptide 3
LFGPPNAALGVLFYIAIMLYPSFTFVPLREELLFGAVAFSCALTVYLGSVLYEMGDFCILCVSTYFINWTLLLLAVRELRSKYNPSSTSSGKQRRRSPAPTGGRARRVLGLLGVLSAVWATLVSGAIDSKSLLSPSLFAVVQTFPLWALVSFGAYSLASIGAALFTFRDCPQAFVELEHDIAEARNRLAKRGFKADPAPTQ